MLDYTPGELARGLVAGSSGNHGKALALAAHRMGTTATIVMPSDAPQIKRDAIAALGGCVVTFDRRTVSRDELVHAVAAQERRIIVPSSDDLAVIAGNGTATLELLEQIPRLDLVLVPVGGGGLAAGSGLAARAVAASTKVCGAEPECADDTIRSLRAGRRIRIPTPDTIADGLRHSEPGPITFPILLDTLADMFSVSEAQIEMAVVLHDAFGEPVEPSGACGLAAVIAEPARFVGRRVGILVTGGNVSSPRPTSPDRRAPGRPAGRNGSPSLPRGPG